MQLRPKDSSRNNLCVARGRRADNNALRGSHRCFVLLHPRTDLSGFHRGDYVLGQRFRQVELEDLEERGRSPRGILRSDLRVQVEYRRHHKRLLGDIGRKLSVWLFLVIRSSIVG